MRKHSVVVVAATVAVMLVAGGAFAASRYRITSINQIKPSVRAQLRGQRGPQGLTGPQGTQGVIGAQGAQGIQGAPGTARAFAVVDAEGNLVQGIGKNVGAAKNHHSGSGIYCMPVASGIDPRAAIATATGTSAGGDAPAATTDPLSHDCQQGMAEVVTYDATAGGVHDEGFVLLLP